MPENSYSEEFEKAYRKKFEHFYAIELKKKELKRITEEYALLRESISYLSRKSSIYPIILGNSFYRISISNIGTFPPYKYTSELIYPMNFSSKKNYKPYAGYQGKKEKILYFCSIGKNGPEIVAEDGNKWVGDNCWDLFQESITGNEYKSFEEFSGLQHATVIKLIENIGDIREFTGYVPFDTRKKK